MKKSTVIKTDIIPVKPVWVGTPTTLNKRAICVFSAIGFFLDTDAYYEGVHFLRPGFTYEVNDSGIYSQAPWFTWHYSPRNISFNKVVDEFTYLFESIIEQQARNCNVILPLSGGLDSRTQAAALKYLNIDVHAYSYAFEGGHDEVKYGRCIAEACEFPFEGWKVPEGYLWKCIERLAIINGCYSEFTHPRQMAFIDRYVELGDMFILGHWGDVLFNDMGVPEDLPFENQVEVVLKKILKKGGMDLGNSLWQAWDLKGDFREYLTERVRELLHIIDIPNSANARIRAFKSLYWAPRWTAVNLSVFESVRPILVPYFDNRMCQFICTVPEKYLAKRQIQIEYLKRRAPALARVPWQEHRPFNLYNYKWDKAPFNWPYRALTKLWRVINPKKVIQRNWELQFRGVDNLKNLEHYLFNNPALLAWIPCEVIREFYKRFQRDPVFYSHPVSMLLTLSLASKHYK